MKKKKDSKSYISKTISDVEGLLNHLKNFDLVKRELLDAESRFPKHNSAHEGFAVLLEEVDELWDVVKMNQRDPARQVRLKEEAIQVAAMAFRFLKDCC